MANELKGLTGTVGEQVVAGTVADGRIIKIERGVAVEFMTPAQCEARKTEEDTPYLNLTIGVEAYAITKEKSFPDYSNPKDPDMPINPNSIHGRIIAIYPDLKVGGIVKMITSKKEVNGNSLIIWDLVLP